MFGIEQLEASGLFVEGGRLSTRRYCGPVRTQYPCVKGTVRPQAEFRESFRAEVDCLSVSPWVCIVDHTFLYFSVHILTSRFILDQQYAGSRRVKVLYVVEMVMNFV